MNLKAYAKINLTLDIVGKREDGYHNLSTVMQEISLYDEITLLAKKNKKTANGDSKSNNKIILKIKNSDIPVDKTNTCYKAAELFLDYYKITDTLVKILVRKNIPVAAGLGGGSSDAAAVFKGLNKLLNINAPLSELEKLSVKVGADVPFFIRGGLQLAEGVGEKLTPLPSQEKPYFIIAKPNDGALSGSVFRDFDRMVANGEITSANYKTRKFLHALSLGNSPFEHTGNMLAFVTERQCSKVRELREQFEHWGVNASMSGSGTAVYGVFSSYLAAASARQKLKNDVEHIHICVAN